MQLPPSPAPRSLTQQTEGSVHPPVRGYRVMKRLATGGTSDVLLARAEGPHGFERVVVLKVLLHQFRDNEEFVEMFALEAAAYARLSHPAIVKLYDFFSEHGELVMVLEYVDGLPLNKLRALLQSQGRWLDDRAAMFIAWRIFGALSAAHSATDPQSGDPSPVIHRDVNPSNVLVPWDGHVKIADFGIAKVAGLGSETKTGLIKGTYGYMAPEQVRGEAVTGRADVYAACLVLWELLARRKAVVRGNASDLDVLRAMAEPHLPSLATLRPELPEPLLRAIARGLTPEPDQRAISAEDLCHALRASGALRDGREALVEAMASVRPRVIAADDQATATSRTTPVRRPLDTLPNVPDVPRAPVGIAPVPPLLAPARAPRSLQPPPVPTRASAPPPLQSAPPLSPFRSLPPTPRGPAGPPPRAPPTSSTSPPMKESAFEPGASRSGRLAPRARARRWSWLAAGFVLPVAIGLVLVLRARPPEGAAPTAATAGRPLASAPLPAVAAVGPAPSPPSDTAPPSPASSSRTGNITVSSSRRGHRIWVDGRLAGEAPASVTVRCGRHSVRVGSRGVLQRVDVPCGGDVDAP